MVLGKNLLHYKWNASNNLWSALSGYSIANISVKFIATEIYVKSSMRHIKIAILTVSRHDPPGLLVRYTKGYNEQSNQFFKILLPPQLPLFYLSTGLDSLGGEDLSKP